MHADACADGADTQTHAYTHARTHTSPHVTNTSATTPVPLVTLASSTTASPGAFESARSSGSSAYVGER